MNKVVKNKLIIKKQIDEKAGSLDSGATVNNDASSIFIFKNVLSNSQFFDSNQDKTGSKNNFKVLKKDKCPKTSKEKENDENLKSNETENEINMKNLENLRIMTRNMNLDNEITKCVNAIKKIKKEEKIRRETINFVLPDKVEIIENELSVSFENTNEDISYYSNTVNSFKNVTDLVDNRTKIFTNTLNGNLSQEKFYKSEEIKQSSEVYENCDFIKNMPPKIDNKLKNSNNNINKFVTNYNDDLYNTNNNLFYNNNNFYDNDHNNFKCIPIVDHDSEYIRDDIFSYKNNQMIVDSENTEVIDANNSNNSNNRKNLISNSNMNMISSNMYDESLNRENDFSCDMSNVNISFSQDLPNLEYESNIVHNNHDYNANLIDNKILQNRHENNSINLNNMNRHENNSINLNNMNGNQGSNNKDILESIGQEILLVKESLRSNNRFVNDNGLNSEYEKWNREILKEFNNKFSKFQNLKGNSLLLDNFKIIKIGSSKRGTIAFIQEFEISQKSTSDKLWQAADLIITSYDQLNKIKLSKSKFDSLAKNFYNLQIEVLDHVLAYMGALEFKGNLTSFLELYKMEEILNNKLGTSDIKQTLNESLSEKQHQMLLHISDNYVVLETQIDDFLEVFSKQINLWKVKDALALYIDTENPSFYREIRMFLFRYLFQDNKYIERSFVQLIIETIIEARPKLFKKIENIKNLSQDNNFFENKQLNSSNKVNNAIDIKSVNDMKTVKLLNNKRMNLNIGNSRIDKSVIYEKTDDVSKIKACHKCGILLYKGKVCKDCNAISCSFCTYSDTEGKWSTNKTHMLSGCSFAYNLLIKQLETSTNLSAVFSKFLKGLPLENKSYKEKAKLMYHAAIFFWMTMSKLKNGHEQVIKANYLKANTRYLNHYDPTSAIKGAKSKLANLELNICLDDYENYVDIEEWKTSHPSKIPIIDIIMRDIEYKLYEKSCSFPDANVKKAKESIFQAIISITKESVNRREMGSNDFKNVAVEGTFPGLELLRRYLKGVEKSSFPADLLKECFLLVKNIDDSETLRVNTECFKDYVFTKEGTNLNSFVISNGEISDDSEDFNRKKKDEDYIVDLESKDEEEKVEYIFHN